MYALVCVTSGGQDQHYRYQTFSNTIPGAILSSARGKWPISWGNGEPSTSDIDSGDGANSNALPNNVKLSAQRVDQRWTCMQQADVLTLDDESSQFMTMQNDRPRVSSRIHKLGNGQTKPFVPEWVIQLDLEMAFIDLRDSIPS